MGGLIAARRYPHGRGVALFPRVIVADRFNGADSAVSLGTADTGQVWTALVGTWGRIGNQAYNPSATTFALAAVDAGVANCRVQVTVYSPGSEIALYARIVDSANWLWLRQSSGGTILLEKMVASARSTVATLATRTLVSGDTLALEMRGTSVTAFLNGGQIGNAQTVTNFSTATKYGIGNGIGSAAQRWDNFRVTAP